MCVFVVYKQQSFHALTRYLDPGYLDSCQVSKRLKRPQPHPTLRVTLPQSVVESSVHRKVWLTGQSINRVSIGRTRATPAYGWGVCVCVCVLWSDLCVE